MREREKSLEREIDKNLESDRTTTKMDEVERPQATNKEAYHDKDNTL